MGNWIYVLKDFDKNLLNLIVKNEEKDGYNTTLLAMNSLYQACEKILKLEEENGLLSKEKAYKDWKEDLLYLMEDFEPYTSIKGSKEEALEFLTEQIRENWYDVCVTFFDEQLDKFYDYADKYRIYIPN